MPLTRTASLLFGTWSVATVFLGATLMSFHQPFRAPTGRSERLLALVPAPAHPQWRAVHLLSSSCGCSQRVLQDLLQHPLPGIAQQILLIDSTLPDLPGSPALIAALQQEGLPITHLAAQAIPQDLGLHGVPLLLLASPDNTVAYVGGYGPRGDRAPEILAQVRAGHAPAPLPILGCAFTSTLQRRTDPFHLKY